jgi:hypothetical protein
VVTGPAGSGKTALVNELAAAVARRRGFLIAGRCDIGPGDVPYATLASALHALVRQVLAASDAEIAAWRERLTQALGGALCHVVDIAPQLALVVGDVPPPPVLPPAEVQHRISQALRHFLLACARRDQPIVLFLDDLQWADHTTLSLLEHLLDGTAGAALLVVTAWRDDEAPPALQATLATLQSEPVLTALHLGALPPAALAGLGWRPTHSAPASTRRCRWRNCCTAAPNYLVGGEAPVPLGNAHPNIVPYQDFPTQDGHMIVAVGNEARRNGWRASKRQAYPVGRSMPSMPCSMIRRSWRAGCAWTCRIPRPDRCPPLPTRSGCRTRRCPRRAPPALGMDTDEVLQRHLGLEPRQIAALRSAAVI